MNSDGYPFGPYRLMERLGEGGSAVVHLARTDDGAPVALKILADARFDVDQEVRFHNEGIVLRSLTHPNIPEYLGSGTVQGRPYIAMEHISGKPIHAYCDERRLRIESRIRLVLQALKAVSYGHRRAVFHRDIKPDNVLVSQVRRVKVVDWGLAKAPEHLHSQLIENETATSQRRGTPVYVSPETLLDEPTYGPTDIYALGVLLYELLTGHVPHDPGKVAKEEFYERRAHLRADPPSQVVRRKFHPYVPKDDVIDPDALAARRSETPDGLSRRLRGALDSIVLKALSPAPDERYSSPDELAADLRAYLDGRPLQAEQLGRLGYLRALLRSYWPALVASVILTVALSSLGAYGVAMAYSNRELDRLTVELRESERKLAGLVLERKKTDRMVQSREQVFHLLGRALRQHNPHHGGNPDASLEDVLAGVIRLADEELAGDVDARAEAYQVVSELYHAMGDWERSGRTVEGLAEIVWGDGGEKLRELPDRFSALAYVSRDVGDYVRATRAYEALLDQARAENPVPTGAHPYISYAILLVDIGRYDEAEALAWEVLDGLETARKHQGDLMRYTSGGILARFCHLRDPSTRPCPG